MSARGPTPARRPMGERFGVRPSIYGPGRWDVDRDGQPWCGPFASRIDAEIVRDWPRGDRALPARLAWVAATDDEPDDADPADPPGTGRHP